MRNLERKKETHSKRDTRKGKFDWIFLVIRNDILTFTLRYSYHEHKKGSKKGDGKKGHHEKDEKGKMNFDKLMKVQVGTNGCSFHSQVGIRKKKKKANMEKNPKKERKVATKNTRNGATKKAKHIEL